MPRTKEDMTPSKWADQAKRFTQHALYHMGTCDPVPDLSAAIACIRIDDEYLPESEMEDAAIPGTPDYPCPWIYGRDCGYRAYS